MKTQRESRRRTPVIIKFGIRWSYRGVHRVLVGKPERKISLRRPRLRWEDNIKTDLQKVEEEGSWGLDGVGSG
jgi:hypothetical protein